MVDIADLNPDFSSRLNQLEAALTNAGISNKVISGYRDNALQAKLYANYQAHLAGRALPYPEEGTGGLAAAPGRSYHNYGMAADLQLGNQADYAKMAQMARQFGLTGIGPNDPGHIQMANWSIPASGAAAGTTINSTGGGFIDALINAESNNRNIFSGVDKDYPGQPGSRSQGYMQIDTPTWQQYGAKAGIDLSKYPSAMNAPRDVQIQVGSLIPVSRFGQRTQNMLTNQFGQFDTSKTVGDLNSQFSNTGTTLNATAATPGTAPAPAAPTTQPSPASLFAQGNIGGGLNQMAAQGMPQQASNLLAAARKPQQQLQPMQIPNLQPNRPNPELAMQMMASLGQQPRPAGMPQGALTGSNLMGPMSMAAMGMYPYGMMGGQYG